MKRILFFMTVICLLSLITASQATGQSTVSECPFYYMKNNKVYYQGEEVFLKTCNYLVVFHRSLTNQLLVGPAPNYYVNWCYPEIQENLTKYLHAHFSLIKQMGFNTIRIMHTSVEPRWNSSNGDLAYRVWSRDTSSFPITQENRIKEKNSDQYNPYYYYEGANGGNLSDYKQAMKVVFDVAQHYELKIIWVTGVESRYWQDSINYKSLLSPVGNAVTTNYINFLKDGA